VRPLNGTTNCGSGVGADGAAWEGCGSAFDVDAGLGCGGRAARGGVGGVFAVVLAGFFVGIAVEAAGGVGGEAFFDVEVNAINDAADGFFLAFAGGGGAGGDGAGRDVGAGEGLDDAGSELGHVGVSTRRAAEALAVTARAEMSVPARDWMMLVPNWATLAYRRGRPRGFRVWLKNRWIPDTGRWRM